MNYRVGVTLEEIEREAILGALKFFQGNRTKAADALGISARTMQNKITHYKSNGFDVPAPWPSPFGQEEAKNSA